MMCPCKMVKFIVDNEKMVEITHTHLFAFRLAIIFRTKFDLSQKLRGNCNKLGEIQWQQLCMSRSTHDQAIRPYDGKSYSYSRPFEGSYW